MIAYTKTFKIDKTLFRLLRLADVLSKFHPEDKEDWVSSYLGGYHITRLNVGRYSVLPSEILEWVQSEISFYRKDPFPTDYLITFFDAGDGWIKVVLASSDSRVIKSLVYDSVENPMAFSDFKKAMEVGTPVRSY